jgi:hypothetical protein
MSEQLDREINHARIQRQLTIFQVKLQFKDGRQVQKWHNVNFTCERITFRTIPRGLGG